MRSRAWHIAGQGVGHDLIKVSAADFDALGKDQLPAVADADPRASPTEIDIQSGQLFVASAAVDVMKRPHHCVLLSVDAGHLQLAAAKEVDVAHDHFSGYRKADRLLVQ